jgi:integrase
LIDFWGDRFVGDVTKETCRAYGRQRMRAPATIRRELSTMRAAFNFAVQEGKLTRAPFVQLPEAPAGRDRWLTKSEAALLLNKARNSRSDVRLYLPLFVLLALYTGQRKSAILALRWPQVDLKRKRIEFNPPGSRRTAKRKVSGQPIPDRLLTFLLLARKRGSDLGHVIHDKGIPLKSIDSSFERTVRDAKLHGVTPHTLRHTCGTWLAQAGVSLHNIGGWLGHADARTTELYAHHHSDHMEDARRAVDRR